MRVIPLEIPGAARIAPEPAHDDRGSFARLFCAETFARHGLSTAWVQMNRSRTRRRGVARGLHLQRAPRAEAKLVRCVSGAVFDAFVDLREGSPTFGRALWVVLSAETGEALHVPEGCAHGFQALTDDVELHYCHSAPHAPDSEAGVSLSDPDLAVPWPLPLEGLSERDAALPRLRDLAVRA